ncbi:SH3 domain-containing protein [Streptomyces sp. NPDC047023]|uniref:SH3 domain-containing protein n=1 Tax=Streptomyces sp. NPDC047023 TaxID=3155139 RepID=UPI003401988F
MSRNHMYAVMVAALTAGTMIAPLSPAFADAATMQFSQPYVPVIQPGQTGQATITGTNGAGAAAITAFRVTAPDQTSFTENRYYVNGVVGPMPCTLSNANRLLTCTAPVGNQPSFPPNVRTVLGVNVAVDAGAPNGTTLGNGSWAIDSGYPDSPVPFAVETPLPGPAGPQGNDGAPGPSGTDGLPGLPGQPGSKGDPGVPGEPGLPGNPGVPGSDGTPGAPGQQGAPGPAGPQGNDGAPGPKGDDGAPGVPGTDGLPGQPGSDGNPGVPGQNGAPGPAGPKGDDGAPGPAGTDGQPGKDGLPGAPGTPGTNGAPGPAGPAGPPGPAGEPGTCNCAHEHKGKGKVVSNGPLTVRSGPSTSHKALGKLEPGTIVAVTCKVNGEKVGDNRLWYRLTDDHGWVPARYVVDKTPIPYCS